MTGFRGDWEAAGTPGRLSKHFSGGLKSDVAPTGGRMPCSLILNLLGGERVSSAAGFFFPALEKKEALSRSIFWEHKHYCSWKDQITWLEPLLFDSWRVGGVEGGLDPED